MVEVDLLLVRHKIHREVEATLCIPDQETTTRGHCWLDIDDHKGLRQHQLQMLHCKLESLLARTPAKEGVAAIRSQI